jgi:arylsulfatase A-like enzyme
VHLPLYAPERFLKQSRNGRYGAAVECVDWSIGVLTHELARLGITENTLMVFTSDNGSRGRGGGSNAPLRGGKGTTFEGGQRLPCIMRWPGRVPAGATCGEITTSMDFLPTFAALAGGAAPSDRTIDGRDIRPLMLGEAGAVSPHDAFFYYFKDYLDAIRRGKWKLFVGRGGRKGLEGREEVRELYDLESDLGETTNVAAQHPDVVAALEKRIEACRADLGDEAKGIAGTGCRAVGRVDDPKPLTTYDPSHPYIEAMYDIKDAG